MAQIKAPPERAPDIIFPETANLFGLKVWIKEHVRVKCTNHRLCGEI